MPKTNQLALCIYKGASLNEQQPTLIVSTGDLPKGFRPVYPTKVDEKEMWTVTHAQEYTLYAYFTKKYRLTDDTTGVMSVYLLFPADYRLAGGRSPLGLIDTIVDMLSVISMTNGIMPQSEVSPQGYKKLLDECELEKRPTRLPLMQGKKAGTLQLKNRTQLDAMFRHSRYPQFNKISCLEMGYECDTTVQINADVNKPKPSPTPNPDAEKKDTDTSTDARNGETEEKKPIGWTTLDTHNDHKDKASPNPKPLIRRIGNAIKIVCMVSAAVVVLCIAVGVYNKLADRGGEQPEPFPIDTTTIINGPNVEKESQQAANESGQAAIDTANAEQEPKELEEKKQKEEEYKAKKQAEAEAKVKKVVLKAEILDLLKQKKKVNLNDPKYKGVLTTAERYAVAAIQDPKHAVVRKNADGKPWRPNVIQWKRAQKAIDNATITSWDDVMTLSRTVISVLQEEY